MATTHEWHNIKYAVEKSEMVEHYSKLQCPMEHMMLRALSNKIAGPIGHCSSPVADSDCSDDGDYDEDDAEETPQHGFRSMETRQPTWVVVPLGVPQADPREFPFQSLICNNPSELGDMHGESGEILKIQKSGGEVLTEDDPDWLVRKPLLLYNKDRTKQTFIHPSTEGYYVILRMIAASGTGGTMSRSLSGTALGGGMNAYFWGRDQGKGSNCVHVNTQEQAPAQAW
jgi:hypothetical protein